jgi:hypothetical protein
VVGTHQTGIKKTRHTVRNVWWQKPTAHVYINCGHMHDMHACTAKNIWAITFYLQKKRDVLLTVLLLWSVYIYIYIYHTLFSGRDYILWWQDNPRHMFLLHANFDRSPPIISLGPGSPKKVAI